MTLIALGHVSFERMVTCRHRILYGFYESESALVLKNGFVQQRLWNGKL